MQETYMATSRLMLGKLPASHILHTSLIKAITSPLAEKKLLQMVVAGPRPEDLPGDLPVVEDAA